MNIMQVSTSHHLATACFQATVTGNALSFTRTGGLEQSVAPLVNNMATHAIKSPRYMQVHMQAMPLTGNLLHMSTGMPPAVTLGMPGSAPLPGMLFVINLDLLRHFTCVMVFANGYEGLHHLRDHLRLMQQNRSEDSLLEVLEALRSYGTVLFMDLNPSASIRQWAFADTDEFRANRLVMERFRPMLRQLHLA